jgi:hypothetical protein
MAIRAPMAFVPPAAWVGAVLLLGGCADNDFTPRGPGGGILEFDAAVFDPEPNGNGDTADLPPAEVNADGVLTTYPHIAHTIDDGFALLTTNFVVTEDGDSRGPLLELFAEIQNTGSSPECQFLPDIWLDFDELVGLMRAQPHDSEYVTTVTTDCIPSGGVGVIRALARGITEDDLATAVWLTLDPHPSSFGTYTPATNGPTILGASLVEGQDPWDMEGWYLSGSLLIGTTIRNYGLRVFPRDDRGVLFADLVAFPNDLGILAGGSTVPFDTSAAPRSFDSDLRFQSWIVESGAFLTRSPQGEPEAVTARRAAMRALAGED